MTLSKGRVPLTHKEQFLEDLSVRRVPANDALRVCDEPGCQKLLSRYNRHKTKCFFHQLTFAERELRREQPTGMPVCGSRSTRGFNYVQLMYHGSVE